MTDTDPDTNPGQPAIPGELDAQPLELEFCDEWHTIVAPGPFVIGREADLSIDDNPYLHRSFLVVRWDRFWWIENVGSALSATISDDAGTMHTWLAPGASLPLLFSMTDVRFTAGPTNYSVALHVPNASLQLAGSVVSNMGTTTLQPTRLTDNQRLLVLSLAEQSLIASRGRPTDIPSSADAARRLGWTQTKFNRQLDTVCQKLAKTGVRGLHGEPGRLASSRRARLVEYALAVRLVTPEDLPFLDQPQGESDPD